MSEQKKKSAEKWPLVRGTALNDYRVFRTRSEIARSPRTGEEHEFFIIEGEDWVNVIPVTPNDEVILIEQYRHGSKQIELEIPGGIIDSKDADPIAAAERELLEETGYRGSRSLLLGKLRPNPAIQENFLNIVLIEGVTPAADVRFDPAEDIHVIPMPLSQIDSLIAHGKITHSLVIAAFHLFRLHREGLIKS
jgi:8-oxo-dGTP pyrophosphatase MutT (NUDIX family)